MDFAFTDEQIALADALRRSVQAGADLPQLAALGLVGDEALGATECMLVAQALGHAGAGAAWISTAAVAAPLLREHAPAALLQALWPQVTQGTASLALACDSARPSRAAVCAQRDGAAWRLQGAVAMVLGGDEAQWVLVPAIAEGTDAPTLFAMPSDAPGIRRRSFRLLDGRGAAHFEFDNALADDSARVGALHGAAALINAALGRAQAALVADSAGALEALLAITCEHLRTRRQFGQPLARFQALQHGVADMAFALEQLKSMACVAALALAAPAPRERQRLLSAARVLSAQLGRRFGLAAIQWFGAMGMTDECAAGRHAKRLITNGMLFGDAHHHLAQVVACSAFEGDTA